jgi:2,3-bisphosphoglycerate-independent phosphoglycerate mutase
MVSESIIKELSVKTDSKILLLVLDGVGGLPQDGETEMERAKTPNLDNLASRSICGLTDAIGYGITPGSGPSHLALFGYDPFKYIIGRGVLEALGIGVELTHKDMSARGNFATMDKRGIIVDRRAGRISTGRNREICALLGKKIDKIKGVKVLIRPGKEHRFVVIFRGDGLSGPVSDADPQNNGEKAKPARALSSKAKKTEEVANSFIKKATEVLKTQHPANTVLLRGISKIPRIPSMGELFNLSPAAIATYPMYKGLARLVGMEILLTGESIEDELDTLKENFKKFDFFYLHIKKTDSSGEDGNLEKKVKAIEEVDRFIPEILNLKFDVIAITSDHSTPCLLKSHSWHPNPFLLHSKFIRVDGAKRFTERECSRGGLGRFPAVNAMALMLANGLKLRKFGA